MQEFYLHGKTCVRASLNKYLDYEIRTDKALLSSIFLPRPQISSLMNFMEI